jgi:bifunctional lysine-specific demethylase and histidyl-hydroxylase MINA
MQQAIDIISASNTAPQRFQQFSDLLAPLSTQRFFDDHWERRPFCIKRERPGYFNPLLSLGDMDHYLGTRTFHEPDIRVVKAGQDKPFAEYARDGVADRHQLLHAYTQGSTLLFSHMNRHHLPLAGLVTACEAELHLPFRANVYLSPANAQGFKLHWDTHDVLVLQIDGKKTWEIYDNPLELPHEDQKKEFKNWVQHATKIAEITLEAGDVLFLPRGFIHGARTADEHSMHITLGMRSLTIGDIVMREFNRVSLNHIEMRKVALHRDYQSAERQLHARAVMHQVIDQLDLQGAIDEVYCSFIRSRQPVRPGGLLQLAKSSEVEHDTALRVRSGALYQLFDKDEKLRLAIEGKTLEFPVGVRKVIAFMTEQESFSANDLPGMEHESRLILVRKLYAAGLIERLAA